MRVAYNGIRLIPKSDVAKVITKAIIKEDMMSDITPNLKVLEHKSMSVPEGQFVNEFFGDENDPL